MQTLRRQARSHLINIQAKLAGGQALAFAFFQVGALGGGIEYRLASPWRTTTTPSSSATTMSPAFTSCPAHSSGRFTEPSTSSRCPGR